MTHHEIKQVLTELIFRVNRHYELHEYEQMAACYTEDAHYKNWRGDTVGRAAILGLMARREPDRLVRHVLSNVMVTVRDERNAEGHCYVTAFLNHHGHPLVEPVPHAGPPAVAEYHFRFRRDAGDWLISEKVTIEVFSPELLHAGEDHCGNVPAVHRSLIPCQRSEENRMSHARRSYAEVECEIRQLMYRMTALYDEQQYDSMLALFTEDAVYKSPSRGELHGRAEILAGISKRPKTRLVRHLLTNIMVDQHDDDNASSRCYLVGAINDSGHPLVKAVPSVGAPAFGEYLMTFRREDGRWRISRKETIEVFYGQTVTF